jgi:flagella basal body P-ring formation protein FlgA
MTWRVLWLIPGLWRAALAGCIPVPGERIVARDLARALPAFAALPPDLALGYAPSPGAVRTYAAAEVSRLARRYGLTVEPGAQACFLGPVETLTGERVAAAMQAAMPGARIEVLEFSRQPVPPGELQFPLSGLAASPVSGPPPVVLWRGHIRRPGQDDFPVWAKARIRVSGTRAVAAEALPPGRPIARAQVRLEAYEGPVPFPALSEVVGRAPRRPIAAGEAILPQWLEQPKEVLRGERVRVEVRSGQTRLLLEGQAQSAGRRGETIPVRNPASGRVFRARVQERGRVAVTAGGSALTGDRQ